MKALGICVGASTISAAGLEWDASGAITLIEARAEAHHGNPRRILLEMLDGVGAARYDRVSVTGRRFQTLSMTRSSSRNERSKSRRAVRPSHVA